MQKFYRTILIATVSIMLPFAATSFAASAPISKQTNDGQVSPASNSPVNPANQANPANPTNQANPANPTNQANPTSDQASRVQASNGQATSNSNVQVNSGQTLDGIAAVVNSDIITQGQLQKQKALAIADLKHSRQPIPSDKELTAKILDHLIDMQLIAQQAKALNININDKQLDQAIGNIAEQNHVTITQFKAEVAKQGMNWDLYREQIRRQLLMTSVEQQAAGSKVAISQDEVDNYIKINNTALRFSKEFHLQGIVMPMPQNPNAQQMKDLSARANTIIKNINGGIDINTVALLQPLGQPVQAGDMGWRSAQQLPPPISEALNTAKVGSAVGPLTTPNGVYIFKYVASRSIPIKHVTDEFQLRHILLREDPLTNAETAQARLANIRSQIEKGDDFAKLAAQYSQDYETVTKGGDLGWATASKLGPEVAGGIANLKAGQISQPIQTQRGWELIQVLARRQIVDTDVYINTIAKQAVFNSKLQDSFKSWLKDIRAKAYIKIYS